MHIALFSFTSLEVLSQSDVEIADKHEGMTVPLVLKTFCCLLVKSTRFNSEEDRSKDLAFFSRCEKSLRNN